MVNIKGDTIANPQNRSDKYFDYAKEQLSNNDQYLSAEAAVYLRDLLKSGSHRAGLYTTPYTKQRNNRYNSVNYLKKSPSRLRSRQLQYLSSIRILIAAISQEKYTTTTDLTVEDIRKSLKKLCPIWPFCT